jgi:hypothetical protein
MMEKTIALTKGKLMSLADFQSFYGGFLPQKKNYWQMQLLTATAIK